MKGSNARNTVEKRGMDEWKLSRKSLPEPKRKAIR
jgi:hypothetical protein